MTAPAETRYYDSLTPEQRVLVDSLTPEQARNMLAYVVDWAQHLNAKAEWSMDDNLSSTETLVTLFDANTPTEREQKQALYEAGIGHCPDCSASGDHSPRCPQNKG